MILKRSENAEKLYLHCEGVHKSRVERHELPEGVCYWQQSSLINNVITPNCPFEVTLMYLQLHDFMHYQECIALAVHSVVLDS